ncbi:hypothetical protein [Runella zeae]|uniref:hypothetical protein n=1 Tax=Runella zeae TaxID=94255 RepID=UPI002356721C|nr:hypothetical protein [Runella zeae]
MHKYSLLENEEGLFGTPRRPITRGRRRRSPRQDAEAPVAGTTANWLFSHIREPNFRLLEPGASEYDLANEFNFPRIRESYLAQHYRVSDDFDPLEVHLESEFYANLHISREASANAQLLLDYIATRVITINTRVYARGTSVPRIQFELERIRDIPLGTNMLSLGERIGELAIPRLNILPVLVALARASERRGTPMGIFSIARPRDSDSFHSHLQAVDLSRYGGHTFNEWAEFGPREINLGLISLIEDLPRGTYGLGLPRLPIRYGTQSAMREEANRTGSRRRGDYTHSYGEDESQQMSYDTITPSDRLMQMPEPALAEPINDYERDVVLRGLNVQRRLTMIENPQYRARLASAIEEARHRGVIINMSRDKFAHVHITVAEPGMRHW